MNEAQETLLFIAPDTLAAASQSLAAAREVRRFHRKARIVCLATPELAPLFEASPYFNSVDADGAPATGKDVQALSRRLRSGGFTGVYDFRGSPLSGRLARGLRPRPRFVSDPSSLGFRGGRPPAGASLHLLDLMARQLAAAGVLEPRSRFLPDMSWLSAVGRRTRTVEPAYFGLNDSYALLLPCAEDREKSPTLKPEEWAELAEALLQRGLRPVLVGSAADRAISDAVRAVAPDIRSFLSRTNLLQLASLSRNATLTVSALAPSAYLAASAGADLVILFGAGDPDPRNIAPRGEGAVVALTPGAARVGVADVLQSARAMGAFEPQDAPVDA